MKTQLVILLLSTLALTGFLYIDQYSSDSNNIQLLKSEQQDLYQMYQDWKLKHVKHVKQSMTAEEDVYRFQIFQENYKFIEEHNSNPDKTVTLKLNKFATLAENEFKSMFMQGSKRDSKLTINKEQELKSNKKFQGGKSINWIEAGAVTQTQYEGSCMSCWSFSAVTAIESLRFIKEGVLENLSNQQVISCDSYSNGCGGGQAYSAMNYAQTDGLMPDWKFPYQSQNVPPYYERTPICKYNQEDVVFQTQGYKTIEPFSPDNIYYQLQKQPVVTYVDSHSVVFQFYDSGVITFDQCHTDDIGYELTIVGYNSEQNYWILRQFWGEDWGENGNVNFEAVYGTGTCGMNERILYPVA